MTSLRLLLSVGAMAVTLAPSFARAVEPKFFDVDAVLAGEGRLQLDFPHADARIAVFTYEDPDGTGLGDYLAELVGNRILIAGHATSLGIIRYQKAGLSPKAGDALSYFDKVDVIGKAQQVALAVWGVVRKRGDGLAIDTFLQIAPGSAGPKWAVDLLKTKGEACGTLQVHLRPDRIALQQLELGSAAANALKMSKGQHDVVRNSPGGAVIGHIPMGQVYSPATPRHPVKKHDGWIYIQAGTLKGWIAVGATCGDSCAPLLNAADFTEELLSYITGRHRGEHHPSKPQPRPGLGTEALVLADELAALEALSGGQSSIDDVTLHTEERWRGASRLTGLDPATKIDREQSPPGASLFANITALGRAAKLSASDGLTPAKLDPIAFDLAEAVQEDPRNVDALNNLSVLFRCSGDRKRADLADKVAKEIGGDLPK